MTNRVLRTGLAAVLALSLSGACGDDDDGDAAAGPSSSTTASSSTTTSTTGVPSSTTTSMTTSTTAATTIPATTTTAGQAGPGTGWSTAPQDDPTMSPDDLYQVRVGRHGTYDRIVFDVNGVVEGPDVVGYSVSYVDGEVLADASGEPVATDGPAALQVVVRAPWLGTGSSGHQPWRSPPAVGDDLVGKAQLSGWSTMRQVAFAGSFEGQTTVAVGVSGELPFRVGAFERDGYSHVYVDIAHPG